MLRPGKTREARSSRRRGLPSHRLTWQANVAAHSLLQAPRRTGRPKPSRSTKSHRVEEGLEKRETRAIVLSQQSIHIEATAMLPSYGFDVGSLSARSLWVLSINVASAISGTLMKLSVPIRGSPPTNPHGRP